MVEPARVRPVIHAEITCDECPPGGVHAFAKLELASSPARSARDLGAGGPVVRETEIMSGRRVDLPVPGQIDRPPERRFRPALLVGKNLTASGDVDAVVGVVRLVGPVRVSAVGPDHLALIDGVAEVAGDDDDDAARDCDAAVLVGKRDGGDVGA